MRITTHNDIRTGTYGTGKEFIIGWVGTDGAGQSCWSAELGVDDDEIKHGADLHLREFLVDLVHHPVVLVEDFGRYDKLDLPLTPSTQNRVRRAREKDAGYQYIRIQHNLHLLARTFLMAAVISAFFSPA